jgi:4-hydroxybenzoate polyprenyltransferase
MIKYLQLFRINNWIKNLLVLSPLLFSFNIFHLNEVINTIVAFVAFCFISSSIYIFNDISDIEKDKVHPRKKYRPLPSGNISRKKAIILALILFFASFAVSFYISIIFLLVILTYFLLNTLYNYQLKKYPIIEAFTISINFLLRILAGSVAIQVIPTEWIMFVTFFLATMLTFIKRKSELMILDEKSVEHRKVLKYYTIQGLNQLIFISAALTLAGYVLYTISHPMFVYEKINWLFYSFIFVAFGIFRFIHISESNEFDKEGDPTTLLLKDKYLQVTVVLWSIYLIWVMYF